MLFSKEDFQINSAEEFIDFLPIFIFCGLVAPFVLVAYKIGFLMDITGWLNKE